MGSGEKQSKDLPLVYNAFNNTQNIFGLKIIHRVNAYIFIRVISIQGSYDKFFFKSVLWSRWALMFPSAWLTLERFLLTIGPWPLISWSGYFRNLGIVKFFFLFLWSINLLQFRNVFLRDLGVIPLKCNNQEKYHLCCLVSTGE